MSDETVNYMGPMIDIELRCLRKQLLCIYLVIAMFATSAIASDSFPFILGKWKVSEVYTLHRGSIKSKEVGTVLSITAKNVNDPLSGGSTPGKVGFREVPAERLQALLKKLDPAWTGNDKTGMRLISVTSDGIDFILFLVMPDGSLVEFSEGDTVYRLERMNRSDD